MKEGLHHIVFEGFLLDTSSRSLFRGDERVHLPKRPFDVLMFLIQRRGELVTREDLLAEFWAGSDAYDEAVYGCISAIRKALDDPSDRSKILETRWREGYAFIADVEYVDPGARASNEAPAMRAPAGRLVATVAAAAVIGLSAWVLLRPPPDDVTPIPVIDSIAVLPVQGRGIDDWLLRGLTDELIHVTSRIEGIRIVSAAMLDADEATPAELGARLGTNALLTSRLDGEGPEPELHMNLISTTDGTVLWSFREPYDTSAPNPSSSAIIRSLANRLSARLRTTSASAPVEAGARLRYLRARQQWTLRTPQSINAAIELYNEVIDVEPDFANAHAGLAEAWTVASLYTGANPSEAYGRAREAAERAIAVDPDNARAHAVLGAFYAHYDVDWRRAEAYFARAIEIDPNNTLAHQWKADAYCYRLLFEDCRYHMSVAHRLDPLSPLLLLFQGIPDRLGKNFVAAEEKFRAVLGQYPDMSLARFQLGLVLDAQGRYEESIEQWERIYPQYGPALLASSLAYAYAQLGEHDKAAVLHDDLAQLRKDGFVSAVMMAGMALTYGTEDEAIDWLEVARDEHDDFYTSIAVIHHFYPLHDHPRFIALTSGFGIPDERLRAFASVAPEIAK